MTIFSEQGNIQDQLQVVVVIIPDIGIGTFRFDKVIPLFPDPERVSFNA
jgi:hypothetical protein